MTVLNTNSARVIDPVLSGIAQGYRHAQRVGHVLFPAISVAQRGGTVIEFGRESFFDYKAKRAAGADAVSNQFGYEGRPYHLDQFSLDVPIAREHMDEAATVPGIDLGKRAVNVAMGSLTLTLTLEIEQAALASNPATGPVTNVHSQGATAGIMTPARPLTILKRQRIRSAPLAALSRTAWLSATRAFVL